MHLGKLHKLLVSNRRNMRVQETRFIGELVDVARIFGQEQSDNSDQGNCNPYAKSMKYAFSTVNTRSPLSAANARAVILQKQERFFEVQKYFAERIADSNGDTLKGLENVIKVVIKEDNLYIPRPVKSIADINQYDTFLKYVADYRDKEETPLSDEDKVKIYADYIAEYYYYSVLWNMVDYALSGADDIREPFMRDAEKCRKIIERNARSDVSQNSHPQKVKVQDNYLLIVMDGYIEVVDLLQRKCDLCRYRLPYQDGGIQEDVLLNARYLVLLLRGAVLVYRRNCESLYRYIKKPKDYSSFWWASLKADNILIVYADEYYLEIRLDQIARDQQGKNKKTESHPDYQMTLMEKTLGKESSYAIDFKPQVEQDVFYISTGDGIVKRNMLSSEGDTTILSFKQKIQFNKISISPNERFILLEEFNRRAILYDREEELKLHPLVESTESNRPDYVDRYLEEQSGDSLKEQSFSSDSRYLLYSHKNRNGYVYEIIDLQTGGRCDFDTTWDFAGFMSDNSHFITFFSTQGQIRVSCNKILADDKGNVNIQFEYSFENSIT